MDNIIFVYKEEWDADHCENSKNIFFGYKLVFFKLVDNILKALIAIIHDNTWKIILIFYNVNHIANHRMFK